MIVKLTLPGFFTMAKSKVHLPLTAYFSIIDMPLDKVRDKSERSALGRYANEYRHGSFGIYHGSEVSGTVQKVFRSKP